MSAETPLRPLTVVIPAYNEQDRLPRTLARLLDWRPRFFDLRQIVIVSDGSVDGTVAIVRDFQGRDPRLELIEVEHGGAMHALIAGYKAAREPFVGNMEADGAAAPEEFDRLAPSLDKAGVATGSRLLRGGLPDIEGKSAFRRLLSHGFALSFRALFRCGVRDPQIGFKIYRLEILRETLPRVVSRHDGIKCSELLLKAYARGHEIAETPVLYRHDPDSRAVPRRPFAVVLGVFAALFGVWLDCAAAARRGEFKRNPVRFAALAAVLEKIYRLNR